MTTTQKLPMKEWVSKIRTEFNDGSVFEGNEIDHALVVGFTAKHRGGVKKTEILKSEMVVDWELVD